MKAKKPVKFDDIKEFSWLSDEAKANDAKALKSTYRKQAAKTGVARFFINFLPILFFGPLFHMAYWFVNAIVVAYKKGKALSAEIATDPDSKEKQKPKAAFYWDWSRVFDGINEKVIELRKVKKYLAESAKAGAEESEEAVDPVKSDQDEESSSDVKSEDENGANNSSTSSTPERSKPSIKRGSVAEPEKKTGEAISVSDGQPLQKKVKINGQDANGKVVDESKDKAVSSEKEAKGNAKAKDAPKNKENNVDTKIQEERQRKEVEVAEKAEEERLRKETEAAAVKAEEERQRYEAEQKKQADAVNKPESKGWWLASFFGSSEPTETSAVKNEKNPQVAEESLKQAQDELGVGEEVI
ncbi:MAG: hypothetical protein SFU25_06300, partial [Candidatus Caenarcaniphilales bacterium]|nr:hypothetical protein [Candidatus Caenarcaniphilales bacterium]